VIVRLQSAVLKALRLLNRLTDAGFLVSLRMLLPRSIRPRPMHREANPPGAPGAAQRTAAASELYLAFNISSLFSSTSALL